MGKASKWFRSLLALKRPDSPSAAAPKEKRRWSFVKSYREKDHSAVDHHAPPVHSSVHAESADPNLPALTAVTVVGGFTREESAAVKIQAAFRGSLARKALRALKGLVKLQALVRGEIERKRTSEWLRRVQTLLRIQAQAQFRAGRAQILHSPYRNANPSTAYLHGSPDKSESPIRSESMKYDHSPSLLKRNSSKSRMQMNVNEEKSWHERRWWSRGFSLDEERCVRILENDSGKAHMTSKGRSHGLVGEGQCYSPLKWNEVEENSWCGGENSPRTLSSSSKNGVSKRSPFTPTKSDGSKSHGSGYSEPDYPSYMAYTESSMAKVRSVSVPKQRPTQYQRSTSSSNSYSLHHHGFQSGDSKLATQRSHANFTHKAYPGSGRLDKLG
ncbi:protein IQ-DOMAIN 14-like [Vigna unguiculata]|uniref:protein IQ-DOMAIN 14-like n=1 Tax=Vigna unguiculata TaxID=3917 RepID=UPI00101634C8|nr:protein IQ-DOMAIN 14-like [Vigna unguiculata]